MRKRILAFALALIMMASLSAFPAMAEDTRSQCACGGKAVGKPDHTCENITFEPWIETDSLPTEGNYYLTENVTIAATRGITGDLKLDLNGHSITRTVTTTSNTQVFGLSGSGSLSITDSSENPGTITRDLSALTEDEKMSITNWGLIFLISNDVDGSESNATGSLNLYDGIFDATGMYAGGGSIISNGGLDFTLNIYGGQLKGGISGSPTRTASVGAIYSMGNINFYGGSLTGSTLHHSGAAAAAGGAAIRMGVKAGNARYLTLSGNPVIKSNYLSDGSESNIFVRHGQLKLNGTFTGTAYFTPVDSYQAAVTAPAADGTTSLIYTTSDDADISGATIRIDNSKSWAASLNTTTKRIYLVPAKIQCECGGTAEGKPGHTCEEIVFLQWTSTTSLPASGNYYLQNSVTTTARRAITSNKTLCLDLNGNSITAKPTSGNTAVFGMPYATASSSRLVITDSTETPGTVTRDLSAYTGTTPVSNYGLIVYMEGCSGDFTLYNGILNSNGTTTGDGSAIYNKYTAYATASVKIYGGEITGGTAANGAVCSAGPVEIYGGKIYGNTVTSSAGSAVRLMNNATLTIGGNAQITGNTLSDGTTPANIKATASQLTMKGEFTGNISITPSGSLEIGTKLGTSDNAVINGQTTIEGYADYGMKISGTDVVVGSAFGTLIDAGMNTYYYDTLSEAVTNYPGNRAVLKLLNDASKESITITQTTYIDLNGNSIGSVNVTAGTLFVFDSQTDDFTVEDGVGYGKIATITGDVQALEGGDLFKNGYLMITEDDGTSFHRLSVDTTGVALRATDIATNGAAIYYQSGFGGDEVIKRNVQAFGIAMGAGKTPDFRAKSYTRNEDIDTLWETGKLNTFNGTLLKNIMKSGNAYSTNNRNSSMQIYSQAYIELVGGTRIMGGTYNLSLKQIMEGTETSTGIDGLWETLQDTQKQPVIDMFNQFQDVMSNWSIPYIKHEITGEEIPYEDDGILKVLLIGHSLGLDSGFFFPEVYKEATGKDVVLGMLYHSGCRLNQHVDYLEGDIKQYAYYEFDTRVDTTWRRADARTSEEAALTFHTVYPGTGNDTLINNGTIGVTMKDGITRADWDYVVMQAGVFEAAGKNDSPSTYALNIEEDIGIIQQYVLDNDIEKRSVPQFAWNITWSAPSAESGLLSTGYQTHMNNFFDGDPTAMFEAIADTYQNTIAPVYDWAYVMPSGTALHNAKTVLSDTVLYRDTIHSSDFGRLMFAYAWTCQFEGKTMDDFDDITSIHSQIRYSATDRASWEDYELTSSEKAILRKCVNAALANPYAITDCSN